MKGSKLQALPPVAFIFIKIVIFCREISLKASHWCCYCTWPLLINIALSFSYKGVQKVGSKQTYGLLMFNKNTMYRRRTQFIVLHMLNKMGLIDARRSMDLFVLAVLQTSCRVVAQYSTINLCIHIEIKARWAFAKFKHGSQFWPYLVGDIMFSRLKYVLRDCPHE